MSFSAGFNLLQLTSDDESFMRSLLGMFGNAFGEAQAYRANQPGADYLRQLLARDTFIALAALENGEVAGGLRHTNCKSSSRSAAKSTSTILPSRPSIGVKASRRH